MVLVFVEWPLPTWSIRVYYRTKYLVFLFWESLIKYQQWRISKQLNKYRSATPRFRSRDQCLVREVVVRVSNPYIGSMNHHLVDKLSWRLRLHVYVVITMATVKFVLLWRHGRITLIHHSVKLNMITTFLFLDYQNTHFQRRMWTQGAKVKMNMKGN